MALTLKTERYVYPLAVIWTVLLALSFTWDLSSSRLKTIEAAKIQALESYKKDLIYRRWNTEHGGVYVAVSDTVQPNPFLAGVIERDVVTPSGKVLTLVNPAGMTRRVSRLGLEEYGMRARITSLRPINPENKPDPWEVEALTAFENVELKEVSALDTIDGEEYMRLIGPLIVEDQCLACHVSEGYEVGSIAGGISVSVPMAPLWAGWKKHLRVEIAVYLAIWSMGLIVLLFFRRSLVKGSREAHLAEEAIREERDKAGKYLDIAGVILVAIDKNGKVTLINKMGCKVLGYDDSEIIGKNWFENFLPERIRAEVIPISKKILAGEIKAMEYYENPILTRDGTERMIAWHNTELKDKEGNITGHLSSGEDITERKLAEEQINTSLKEKEILLKEVHHRVKNNLQVISSILNIQSTYTENRSIESIFKESQDRIRSMALVHERLYQSTDLANINFANYVRDLASNIFTSYHCAGVQLKLDVEDIRLDIDHSIILGLILNELCTNALKYGFPDGSTGELRVEFHRLDGDRLALIVSDNGVGLPDEFDLEKTDSMGLLLVKSMVSQLDGTIEVDGDEGTAIKITFTLAKTS